MQIYSNFSHFFVHCGKFFGGFFKIFKFLTILHFGTMKHFAPVKVFYIRT